MLQEVSERFRDVTILFVEEGHAVCRPMDILMKEEIGEGERITDAATLAEALVISKEDARDYLIKSDTAPLALVRSMY